MGAGTGFTQEFDWVGTRDPTPWLVAPEGIRFLQSLDPDGVAPLQPRSGLDRRKALTDRWGTPLDMPESSVGVMVTVMTAGTMRHDESRRCPPARPAAVRAQHRGAGPRARESRLGAVLRAGL